MKLRNEFNGDLEDLIKTYAIDKRMLENKLATINFKFNSDIGKFL